MASYSVTLSKHATLVASTADTVTLTGGFDAIEVVNRSDTDTLYARFDGTAPTVAGSESVAVPPGAVYTWPRRAATVKLISAGTPDYSVQGVP